MGRRRRTVPRAVLERQLREVAAMPVAAAERRPDWARLWAIRRFAISDEATPEYRRAEWEDWGL